MQFYEDQIIIKTMSTNKQKQIKGEVKRIEPKLQLKKLNKKKVIHV